MQEHYIFNRVTQEDLPLLHSWFQKKHVAEWWPVPKQQRAFNQMFLKRIASTDIITYLVHHKNEPIAYIQYYAIDLRKNRWLPELPKNTVGIDQFIGIEELLGKGHGTQFIKEFITLLIHQKGILSFIVDPNPTNSVAIRCYEKIGFKKLGEFQAPWGPSLVMHYQANR